MSTEQNDEAPPCETGSGDSELPGAGDCEEAQHKESVVQEPGAGVSGGVEQVQPDIAVRVQPEGVTRRGRVVERLIGGHSKQSRRGPVLDTPEGVLKVYVLGDNPFAASQFSKWLGQMVEVVGVWRGDTLRVAPGDIRPIGEEVSEEVSSRHTGLLESGESTGEVPASKGHKAES